MEKEFGFKDLKVWQKSMDFADAVLEIAENISSERKHFRLIEQIESSSTSVPQNIAEGKGRNSQKEFIHFLYISRGSLYETVTLLNIFYRRKWISSEELNSTEEQAFEIASMLKGLINSIKT
jgi:four helix bundle protein